jgi:hypothetical protein
MLKYPMEKDNHIFTAKQIKYYVFLQDILNLPGNFVFKDKQTGEVIDDFKSLVAQNNIEMTLAQNFSGITSNIANFAKNGEKTKIQYLNNRFKTAFDPRIKSVLQPNSNIKIMSSSI